MLKAVTSPDVFIDYNKSWSYYGHMTIVIHKFNNNLFVSDIGYFIKSKYCNI